MNIRVSVCGGQGDGKGEQGLKKETGLLPESPFNEYIIAPIIPDRLFLELKIKLHNTSLVGHL